VTADLGRHQDQLAVLKADEAARRVVFRIEAVGERGFERVDRDDRGQVALDVRGREVGKVHVRLTLAHSSQPPVRLAAPARIARRAYPAVARRVRPLRRRSTTLGCLLLEAVLGRGELDAALSR